MELTVLMELETVWFLHPRQVKFSFVTYSYGNIVLIMPNILFTTFRHNIIDFLMSVYQKHSVSNRRKHVKQMNTSV